MPSLVTQLGYFKPLHSKYEGQLSSMMDIMGQDAPDRPLVRYQVDFSSKFMAIGTPEVLNGPLMEGIGDHLPAILYPAKDDFLISSEDGFVAQLYGFFISSRLPGAGIRANQPMRPKAM